MKSINTILLVEDEPIIAVGEKNALEKRGYTIIAVSTGEEAVKIFIENKTIDLVLMDIDLGSGIDGIEAAKLIVAVRNVPIVFLSNHTESEVVDKTESINFYGYVVKNTGITVIDASIKMAYKLFEANREIEQKEELFQSFFNSTIVGAAITEPDGKWLHVNDTLCSMLGYTREELQKSTWKKLTPKDDLEKEALNYQAVLEGKYPDCFEKRFIRKDGSLLYVSISTSIVKNKKGTIERLSSIIQDITERKNKEEKLVATEKLLRETCSDLEQSQALAHIGTWKLELETHVFTASEEGLRIFGFPLNSKPSFDDVLSCMPPEDQLRTSAVLKKALKNGHPYNSEVHIQKKDDKKKRTVVLNAEILYDTEGNPCAVLGTNQDITERKRAELSLWEFSELYRSILNASPDAIIITDMEGRILMASPVSFSLFGCIEQELLGHVVTEFIINSDKERALSRIALMAQNIDLDPGEYHVSRPDGKLFDIEVNGRFICGSDGLPKQMILIIRDITRRKQAEEKIKTLLGEKELILREVHHRIKNNMNTIYGLLVLQAGTMKDPVAVNALSDAGSRVRSMMLLYDKLYKSVDYNEISILQYLPSLIEEIVNNFPKTTTVMIEKKIDDFVLDVKKLQPLGILINELLTNIMKYAFTDRTEGKITVSASVKERLVTITIADNGNGMPESVSFENSTGFGLVLVNGLTNQLDGTIHIERIQGTQIILEFKI